MKSVFFRRLLTALVLAVLLASAFLVAGYFFFSLNIYRNIKLSELEPKAQAAVQLELEYRNGQLTPDAYERMSEAFMRAAGATFIVFDQEGKVMHFSSATPVLQGEEANKTIELSLASMQGIVAQVLSGNTVTEKNFKLDNNNEVLVAASPIVTDEGVAGGVIVVKSLRDIKAATDRMSLCLLWLAAVVIPLMLLVVLWRVRKITSPLHDMSEAALEISKGNFDIYIDEGEVGEVGVLARALNRMTDTLSQTIYQLSTEKLQLDAILQSLTDGVAVTDSRGILTHYNPAIMRMFGAVNVEKRSELIADPAIWEAFEDVYVSGEPQTLKYPMSNDRMLWITISPVVNETGERTGIVGLFKDMTEAERLEATRREYVANVSHELRTPLTAVRGLLEPLADGMVHDEEDRQRYYKIMLHEVGRLSRLITDMLMLSRLQSGTEYMNISIVDMNELINDVASGYAQAARQKGIELLVDADKVPEALTDADRVEQVLVILVDNAIRYTDEGGSVTISIRNGERLLVSVEDTGRGIPEEDIPHVFERFYKVDKSHNEAGTGLGLSIAAYIMQKLEESLTVQSEMGQGTRFTFTLKKYVSNAIELGPAQASVRRKGTLAVNKQEVNVQDPSDALDASYEIIHDQDDAKGRDAKK